MLKSDPTKPLIKALIARANAARDAKSYVAAAALYEAALEYRPGHAGLHMQAGHMHKEAHDFDAAERHYMRVLDLAPDDPEIHLQLGHFNKVRGRLGDARNRYERAASLNPSWSIPQEELKGLDELEFEREQRHAVALARPTKAGDLDRYDAAPVFINPALYPKAYEDLLVEHRDAFIITRMGNHQRTRWGEGNTLRQIDSIRGYIISTTPYLYVDIFLDGKHISREPMTPGKERREKTDVDVNKYSFNAWIDLKDVPYGWHEIILKGVNVKGESRENLDWRRERVVVAEPLRPDAFRESDGWIPPLDARAPGSLEDKINALPSVVHKASSRSVPVEPRTILVQRLDQLGDMSVSVPALRRLREIVPEARIVGLLGPANEGLGRTLGLFDDIVVFDFPDDPIQEDRILDREGQLELSRLLEPYNFDVAFDLSYYGTTRQLLPLSRAPVMIGFGDEPWLTLSLSLHYNEGRSRRELLRHAGKTRMLIEAFAAWLDSGARVERRADLDIAMLRQYGILPGDQFVVLHAGARIKFTRWPYFAQLAEKLLEETGAKVVLLADDSAIQSQMTPRYREANRIVFIHGKIPFDHFDAMVSFCSSFVGNDSGPKHLAALRGANVVSVHSARTNWSEWGQDPSGVIISRTVPCAGCGLHHNPEECAKGVVCITGIKVDEVFREVVKHLE